MLYVKLMSDAARQPVRHHNGDAGYDLYSTKDVVAQPGVACQVPHHLAVALPEGYWGLITGRSSSWAKGLHVPTSIIDNGYTGELFTHVLNVGTEPMLIEAGHRVSQLILVQLAPAQIVTPVQELIPQDRGNNGFGSTGT